MNASQFMKAMEIIEQDHELVLRKIRALKDTVNCLMDVGGKEPRQLLARLEEINDFFGSRFAAHLEEEEPLLFPFLELNLPDGAELVARLRNEHEAILRKRQEFSNCLEVAAGLGSGFTKPVLLDMLSYGWELWELLDQHANTETQALRRCLSRCLSGISQAGKEPAVDIAR